MKVFVLSKEGTSCVSMSWKSGRGNAHTAMFKDAPWKSSLLFPDQGEGAIESAISLWLAMPATSAKDSKQQPSLDSPKYRQKLVFH